MKKKIAVILVIIILPLINQGKKICSLTDGFFKQPLIKVDANQIYIVDQGTKRGFIYEKENFRKIAEFIRFGKGPGELVSITALSLDDKYIYVSSYRKLCVFSKTGKLIKEITGRTPGSVYYIPFGDKFVGCIRIAFNPYQKKRKIQFSLFDNTFNKLKDILVTEIQSDVTKTKGKDLINWIRDYVGAVVYNNKLYIGSTEKGFHFAVFNIEGEKILEILKDEKQRKVTEEEKKFVIDSFKSSMGSDNWNQYKSANEIIFPEYYPAYTGFFVDENKIYTFRYPEFGVFEISVLDSKGNTLKNSYLALMALGSLELKFSDIFKGKLYRLIDNGDEWELHEFDF